LETDYPAARFIGSRYPHCQWPGQQISILPSPSTRRCNPLACRCFRLCSFTNDYCRDRNTTQRPE
jgi:hypothetical protein